MLNKMAVFSALCLSIGATYAYQAEVGASYKHLDYDYSQNSGGHRKSIELDGTYYLKPVEIKNNPLNEATFLNRASNFKANISHSDYKWNNFDYDSSEVYENELTLYQVGVEYFVPKSQFYLSANIGHKKSESSYKQYDDGDLDYTEGPDKKTGSFYSAEVGYSPINGLLIVAGLTGETDNADDDTVIDPTLRAKYVTTVGKYDANFEGSARFGEDTDYTLGADLYLDKTLSVGAVYSASNNSYDEDDALAIRAKKFFTPQISLEASANISGNVDGYGLRAGYRF